MLRKVLCESLSCGELLGHDLEDPEEHQRTGESHRIIIMKKAIFIPVRSHVETYSL